MTNDPASAAAANATTDAHSAMHAQKLEQALKNVEEKITVEKRDANEAMRKYWEISKKFREEGAGA